MPNKVSMSLVVVTRNRPSLLRRLIDSLQRQDVSGLDVVIVDQSDSTERQHVRGLVESCAAGVPVQLVEDTGTGLSRGRNLGLRLARGDIVGFPDDDCWYDDGLVRYVTSWLDRHPEYDFVAGVFSEPGVWNSIFPRREREISYWRGGVIGVCSVGLFFRRRVVEHPAVRFSENLGAGRELVCSEETDFVFACVKAGFRGRFVPDLVVFHPIKAELFDPGRVLKVDKARQYVLYRNRSIPEALLRLASSLGLYFSLSLVSARARQRLAAKLDGVRLARQDAGAVVR